MTLARRIAAALRLGHWERDEQNRLRRGSWMQSFSGAMIWPLDPRPDEVHYDDLVVGLARECRYGRMCREFYSVAEHSVIVSQYAEKLARERGYSEGTALAAARIGLLHDGSEAFLGDVPRPIKHQPAMRGYRRLEKKWQRAINTRFAAYQGASAHEVCLALLLVKEVDTRLLLDEIEALMIDPDMWSRTRRYDGVEPLGAEIAALSSPQAAHVFTQRFCELWSVPWRYRNACPTPDVREWASSSTRSRAPKFAGEF